jgi:hypothetical protein
VGAKCWHQIDEGYRVFLLFSKERLLELFFLSVFFYASFSLFFLCSLFSMLCLFIEDEFGDFWNVWEESNFFKLSFKWDRSGYIKIYEIAGVAENLLAVDAYPGMDIYTPTIFFFGWG